MTEANGKPTPICIDCKWYKYGWKERFIFGKPICSNPKLGTIGERYFDVVTGIYKDDTRIAMISCHTSRSPYSDKCGRKGTWFEAKK